MSQLTSFFRATLWWLAPLAVLLLAIGWEIGWGAGLRKPLPASEPPAA